MRFKRDVTKEEEENIVFATSMGKYKKNWRIKDKVLYLRCVGNTSVIKQSNDALPHAMTPVKNADTMKFCCLFCTKYMPAEQTAADIVLNIRKNLRPSLSMPRIAIKLAGNAADSEMSDSKNTELGMVAEHAPMFECEPELTTYSVTWHTVADWPGCVREYSSKRLNNSGNHIIKP